MKLWEAAKIRAYVWQSDDISWFYNYYLLVQHGLLEYPSPDVVDKYMEAQRTIDFALSLGGLINEYQMATKTKRKN